MSSFSTLTYDILEYSGSSFQSKTISTRSFGNSQRTLPQQKSKKSKNLILFIHGHCNNPSLAGPPRVSQNYPNLFEKCPKMCQCSNILNHAHNSKCLLFHHTIEHRTVLI